MKRMLTVLAVVISAAVSQVAMAAVSFTISADKKTADFAFDASHREQVLYFAYGNANGGDSTNGWENVEKIADIAAQATEAKNVSLPEGCGTAWGICRAFLLNAGTAKDYAKQDNLVVQYDGIENAGYGTHATTLTSWKDLKGDHDLPVLSGDTVAANYIEMLTNAHTTASAIIPSYKALFFELHSYCSAWNTWPARVISVPRVGRFQFKNSQQFLATVIPWSENGTWKNAEQTFKNGGVSAIGTLVKAWHTYSMWMSSQAPKSVGGVVPVRYLDGTKRDWHWDGGRSGAITLPSELTLTLNGTYKGVKNRFASVRVYDCQLTGDEIAANRALDLARFQDGPLCVFAPSALTVIERPFAVKKLTKAADGKTPVSADLVFTAKGKVRKLYIAYGRTDGGDDPTAWDGSEYVCDIPAYSSEVTATIPDVAAAYLAKKGGYRFLLGKDATAKDYVRQENLVVQYDGIENAGYGTHADSLTAWKDLKGGHDLPIFSDDVVTADCVKMTTNAHTTAEAIISSYQALFFETYSCLNTRIGENGPWQMISVPRVGTMGFYAGQNAYWTSTPWKEGDSWQNVWQVANSGKWHPDNWKGTWVLWSSQMASVPPVSIGGLFPSRYVNAELKGHNWDGGRNWGACPQELTLTVGGNFNPKSGIAVSHRSIRIYNVNLTAAEVAYNLRVDLSRFEDGDPVVFDATDFAKANNFGLIIVVE